LVRIVSEKTTLHERLRELKTMLLGRDYDIKAIENAFQRALQVDRKGALKRVERKPTSGKLTFVTAFDPRLPNVNSIVKKHFDFMTQTDLYLKRVFAAGVQVAFSRHRNLRDLICRATLYKPVSNNGRPARVITGWKRCLHCTTCKYSRDVKQFKCTATGELITINQKICCTDSNVIYVIECSLCLSQYVGRTSGQFRTRMNAHRSSIGKSQTAIAKHFELKDHQLHHFVCFAIEIVSSSDPFILGARERLYIDKMDVIARGININRTNK